MGFHCLFFRPYTYGYPFEPLRFPFPQDGDPFCNGRSAILRTILIGRGSLSEDDEDNQPERSFGGGYWARRRQRTSKTDNAPINLVDDDDNNNKISSTTTSTSTSTSTISLIDEDNVSNTNNQSMPPCNQSITNNNQNKLTEQSEVKLPTQLNEQETADIKSLLSKVKCSICLEQLTNITSTVCGHIFCEDCIVKAIKSSKKCPICRCKLTQRNIHPIFL